MSATTRQPVGQARWPVLLRPRWLAWHAFAVVATVGMFYLGDWQLHRAESGNELSWAYTFEWPLFAVFGVYFWIKSLRDELREHGADVDAKPAPATAVSAVGESAAAVSAASGPAASGPAATHDSHADPAAAPGAGVATGATAAGAASTVATTAATGADRRADSGDATSWDATSWDATSWDATSWDATSWDATGRGEGADGAAGPVDISRATPADGEAYMARLMAEVQRSGRGRGRR
jgi:DNA-binding transcriptional regulator of glucitol operon